MGSAESIGSWSEAEALEWQESNAAAFPIVELRQYKLHDGRRDTLIELFERAFIEPQEALGMKVIGIFRDLDRPDRFVWLRGFRDMDSRVAGLTDFYDGSVWKAHREAANATMIDSDNVLLLRALDGARSRGGGSTEGDCHAPTLSAATRGRRRRQRPARGSRAA